jgi:hypothetical protein
MEAFCLWCLYITVSRHLPWWTAYFVGLQVWNARSACTLLDNKNSRWNALWAIPWGAASFLLVGALVWFPVFLLGLVGVPLMLWTGRVTLGDSRVNAGQCIVVFEDAWAQCLWGNWEDGLAPLWWVTKNNGKPYWLIRYLWYLRNPVCNMRFWPLVSTLPSSDTHWCGTLNQLPSGVINPGWFLAWRGCYVGFYWQRATWGTWWGWKVNPLDARQPCTDYRRFGLGIACQPYIKF